MSLLFFIITLSTFFTNAVDPESLYQEKNYDSVISHYQTYPPLYGFEWILIGNSYAENNQPAHAIAAWRKAEQTNNSITYYAEKNIARLKKNIGTSINWSEIIFYWLSFCCGRIPLIILQICFLLLCFLFAQYRQSRWIASILLLFMTVYLYMLYTHSFSGVILHETLVHVGPHTRYESQGTISATQEVTVLRLVNTWYHIQYGKQQYGWVSKDSLITYQNM